MKSDWAMMLAVQLSLWSFYALLLCLALRHWLAREAWPVRLGLPLLLFQMDRILHSEPKLGKG